MKLEYMQEYAGSPSKVRVEGRVLKNVLLLGSKSQNRNRKYGPLVRTQTAPLFKGRSVFNGHTEWEKGQRYYRRPYTDVFGTVVDAWNDEDGIRGDVALAHHPISESVIKNINDGIPIGGMSPEMIGNCVPGEDGEEECTNISAVHCVALVPCPGTGMLTESEQKDIEETVVDESTVLGDFVEDAEYHKRRQLMSSIEAILMEEIEEEEGTEEEKAEKAEKAEKKKFLRIHQMLGEHLKVFAPIAESVLKSINDDNEMGKQLGFFGKETGKEITESVEGENTVDEVITESVKTEDPPVIRTALPPDFVKPEGHRLSGEEIRQQIWGK
jgi:hypothetical protein